MYKLNIKNISNFIKDKRKLEDLYQRSKLFIFLFGSFFITWIFISVIFNINSPNKKGKNLKVDERTIQLRKRTGVKKYYYPSGKLKIVVPYKFGKMDGVRKHFYEDGALQSEKFYKEGKEWGIEKYYYEDGSLSSEIPFKNGNHNGVARYYHRDGTLKRKIFFKNNRTRRVEEYPLVD